MTVLETLQWANKELKLATQTDGNAGNPFASPMLDAEVLLAHALGMQRSWLFSHLSHEVKPHETDAFRELVRRRGAHEPVAYLTGKKEFFKRRLEVSPHVLIPRPETETLVEEAIRLSREGNQDKTVFADVGCGSGAIAVTLAAQTGLPVMASDKSPDAIAMTQKNAALHNVSDLVDAREGHLLDPLAAVFHQLSERSPFTRLLLCANLPYLTEKQWEECQRELHFEPREALVAGADGLDAYWQLLRDLRRHRNVFPPLLTLLLEIDPQQVNRLRELVAHDFPHADVEIKNDLAGLPRVALIHL